MKWLNSLARGTFHLMRQQTGTATRFAFRFNRIARYGWDMVLWSHFLGRPHDPIPVEFPMKLLQSKGIEQRPPALHVSGFPEDASHWDEGFAAAYAVLLLNLQTPDMLSAVRYAHPAPAFQGVYLWDSAFISQVWRPWDVKAARDVNLAVVALRDEERIQHVVADLFASKYTQPPLLAWSIWECCREENPASEDFLEQVYPVLTDYHRWLRENRRFENGLYFWQHPYESGIDNAPRFSNRDEKEFADTRKLASPDFGAYAVLHAETLEKMATRLGRAKDAHEFRNEAEELRGIVNEHLWHAEDGLYYDKNMETGEWVRSKTISSLLPFWSGIPDETQARRLLEHVMDPEAFNTRIPLPTVSLDDPDFVKDMWRGPVWINTAYGVILGLERYGFWEEASDLAYRLCDGVYRTFEKCRRFYEFYDPDRFDLEELHRKNGNRWKQWTLGRKPVSEFVGWTGLVNTLVIELIGGFRRVNGKRELRPLLPKQSVGISFSIRIPSEQLAFSVERDAEGTILSTIRSPRGVYRYATRLGEAITIDEPPSPSQTQDVPSHLEVRS